MLCVHLAPEVVHARCQGVKVLNHAVVILHSIVKDRLEFGSLNFPMIVDAVNCRLGHIHSTVDALFVCKEFFTLYQTNVITTLQ